VGFWSPLIISFQRALTRDPDFVQAAHATKGLQEGAVGQTDGKVSVRFAQKDARDIAAQGATGLFLKSQLRLGRRLAWGTLGSPPLQALLDELCFQTAVNQKLIDALKLPAQLVIVDIAHNGGQSRLEMQFEGDDGTGHELDYKLAWRMPIKKCRNMQTTYPLKIQAIRSQGQQPRLYVSFPLALAAAIGLEPGDSVQWELLDRDELHLVRLQTPSPTTSRRASKK